MSAHRKNLDGDLAVLRAVRREAGLTGPMTLSEMAECVGCSKQSLHRIERKAFAKVRVRLLEKLNHEVEVF